MIQQQVEVVNASLSSQESATSMARDIQARINTANAQGWECVGISNVQASVAGGHPSNMATTPRPFSVALGAEAPGNPR